MELFLDKAWGIILALFSALTSMFIYFHKRTANEVKQVARDLVLYKEYQARETEMHRSKISSEMSDLKARLEGVTTALGYMNKNIADIQNSVGTIAALMQERNK